MSGRLLRLVLCILVGAILASPCHVRANDDADTKKASAKPSDKADSDRPEEKYPLATKAPKPEPVVPPTKEELDSSITRGVDYLLGSQRKSGAWGGPQRTKGLNIYAPGMATHLAFRTGATSLAILALCESRDLYKGERREKIESAIDRGQTWLLENSNKLVRDVPDASGFAMRALYNVWGHAYALQVLVPLYERADGNKELQEKLVALAKYHTKHLATGEYLNGGWGYYDEGAHTMTPSGSPTSFTTATALIALKLAEQKLGVEFPDKGAQKAVESLLRQRNPDFSYDYGEYLRFMPRLPINRPGGSLGRSQACNLALRMYGHNEVTDEIMEAWLDRLFARNGWLSIGRKRPIPHESYFQIAGYFYYYGHFYAALCIEELPKDKRAYFFNHLARILMPLQEKDGSWWDYPLYDYHQAWGTGMAVSALVHCRKNLE
jgi:hypothetical protein